MAHIGLTPQSIPRMGGSGSRGCFNQAFAVTYGDLMSKELPSACHFLQVMTSRFSNAVEECNEGIEIRVFLLSNFKERQNNNKVRHPHTI